MFRYLFRYCIAILCVALFVPLSPSVPGQIGRQLEEVPSRLYLENTLPTFFQGNFNETLAALNRHLSSAVRIPQRNQAHMPWLDSIAYWALQGECHFHMARYDDALTAFDTALQIYMEHHDWFRHVEMTAPPNMAPRAPLPWGASTRPGNIADFSQSRFQYRHERAQLVTAGDGVGFQAQTTLSRIHAEHIVQCIALAIRRRHRPAVPRVSSRGEHQPNCS